ncbi:MAG: amidohydrolase family protein [Actinomycetia bacterium]|nr:amidohydrolase family protein [Actinomycetes bacterium]
MPGDTRRLHIVGLEEHFVTTDVLQAWHALSPADRDLALAPASSGETGRLLLDLGAERLAVMDATGLDVAVLSLTTPGLHNLPKDTALGLQTATNDLLADTVRGNPQRFQGLAALATAAPPAAAGELQRAVTELGLDGAMLFGRTADCNLDDHAFWEIFEAAGALCAPLHLHPQSPPPAVRQAYYDGFPADISAGLATHGIGWHYDSGIQFLRLVLAGVFDRFPDLQVVIGHFGELVLFYLERVQHVATLAHLPLTLQEYARRNLYITPSGIPSQRYLRWATEIIGVDRILFATDYPFEHTSRAGARQFLETADIPDTDRHAISHANWQHLRERIRR